MNKADNDAGTRVIDSLINYEVSILVINASFLMLSSFLCFCTTFFPFLCFLAFYGPLFIFLWSTRVFPLLLRIPQLR